MSVDTYYSISRGKKKIWIIQKLLENRDVFTEISEPYIKCILDRSPWFHDSDIKLTVRDIIDITKKLLNNELDFSQLDEKVAEHCSRIIKCDLEKPIIILLIKEDYQLIDGYHRLAKTYLRNINNIKIVKLVEMPEPDKIELV